MIAIIQHAATTIADFFRFAAAVWRDARKLQSETEDQYGLIGF